MPKSKVSYVLIIGDNERPLINLDCFSLQSATTLHFITNDLLHFKQILSTNINEAKIVKKN